MVIVGVLHFYGGSARKKWVFPGGQGKKRSGGRRHFVQVMGTRSAPTRISNGQNYKEIDSFGKGCAKRGGGERYYGKGGFKKKVPSSPAGKKRKREWGREHGRLIGRNIRGCNVAKAVPTNPKTTKTGPEKRKKRRFGGGRRAGIGVIVVSTSSIWWGSPKNKKKNTPKKETNPTPFRVPQHFGFDKNIRSV